MFLTLSFLWFIRIVKSILFWLYLWQLKEYHFGRFFAHFKTVRGRGALLNKMVGIKTLLLFISFLPSFYLILFVLYLLELAKAAKDFFAGGPIRPVLTKKTFFLFSFVTAIFIIAFFYVYPETNQINRLALRLLILDILSPLIISLTVLFLQPFTVLWRSWIINKAKIKREGFKDLLVIGITGSYGKTSAKEFLYEILSENFRVLKTKEHQNSEIGISRCVLDELEPDHQIFIVEMGAYNRGGIKLLADIVKPKIGILTGINEQHLDTFGSQENIISAKFELIESLPDEGIAIFNADNPFINSKLKVQSVKLRVKNKRLCSIMDKGVKPPWGPRPFTGVDLWAENIRIEKEQLSFRVLAKDGESADFKLNLLGGQNIINILMASQAAKELGMSLNEIASAGRKIKQEQGGMKLIKEKNGLNIVDATYSANPESVTSHLEYLRIWESKKMIIMPSLIELREAAEEIHKKIGNKIAEVCELAIITTQDGVESIKEGAREGGMSEGKIIFIEDPAEIVKVIINNSGGGDVVLLESRVPKEVMTELLKKEGNS